MITTAAMAFVAARLVIRYRYFRNFLADDHLTVLAMVFLIAHGITTTVMAAPMYELLDVASGQVPVTPDFQATGTFFLKCQIAATFMVSTCKLPHGFIDIILLINTYVVSLMRSKLLSFHDLKRPEN